MRDVSLSSSSAWGGGLTRAEALRAIALCGVYGGTSSAHWVGATAGLLSPIQDATAAPVSRASRLSPYLPVDDAAIQTTAPLKDLLYRNPSIAIRGMSTTGVIGTNALWERGLRREWYIEEQRGGEVAAIGGIVTHHRRSVEGALRLFDWGFRRQTTGGDFAGTADPFHSTSFFVAAVAHTCLFARQAAEAGLSPLAAAYGDRIARYAPFVVRAAHWMAQPRVWSAGLLENTPFTHRRYLVGAALGLAGLLAADRALIDRARDAIGEGVALQRADGVNPERGGYDSSYQMTGVVFAQYWAAYFPDDPLTPRVQAMIERAVHWEAGRVEPTGAVSARGNTRTAGQEPGRDGLIKTVAYSRVIRGFATWGAMTGDARWTALAWRTGRHYYTSPALAARPLLP